MRNDVAVKVYKVDYDFIIKNYLSPAMWEKTWTLFVYRDISITLDISYITVRPRKICFDIKIRQGEYMTNTSIYYHIDNSNYNVLKKQINGAIETLIGYYENGHIRQENDYRAIKNAGYDEEDLLTEIANKFLDENGVTNEDIREVYIDAYVSNNKKTNSYLSNYLSGRKYRCKSDIWLVYYKAVGDEVKYQEIINILRNEKNFDELLSSIKESISIFNEEERDEDKYNEYVDELYSCLDEI